MRKYAAAMLVAFTALGCSDDDGSPTAPMTTQVRFAHEANHRLTPLSGSQEVPQRTSGASGEAIFHVAVDGTKLGYNLRVQNISNVFQAHIHLAPAGQNGGIVAWLYPSVSPGAGPTGGDQ